jgi:hypothetical protein
MSAFSSDGRKQHRVRYERFESACLHFLKDLDWKSVAGQAESAELHAIETELNQALAEIDKVQRRIAQQTLPWRLTILTPLHAQFWLLGW